MYDIEDDMIDQRGSLGLAWVEGDETSPETYTVFLLEDPSVSASLEVAWDWFELGDRYGRPVKLNGSQVASVKYWVEAHLDG